MSNEMPEKTQDGGPAFPVYDHHGNGQPFLAAVGMTMRDYFAAKAMQAMLSAYPCQAIHRDEGGVEANYAMLAEDAFSMADALLTARQEQPK